MKQEVDVVFGSADSQHIYVMVLGDACEIGPDTRLQFLHDYFAAILGAKDYVHVVFREGVRQCVAPFAETRYRGLMLSQSCSQRFRAGLLCSAPGGALFCFSNSFPVLPPASMYKGRAC